MRARPIVPNIKPLEVPRGAAAGVGRGALWGLKSAGVIAGTIGAGAPPAGLAGGMIGVGSALVLGTMGAVAGGIDAEPAEVVAQRETQFRTIVAHLPLQETLRERVVAIALRDTGRAVIRLRDGKQSTGEAPGADAILEVAVEEIGLTDRGAEFPGVPALWLTLTTRSRLVDPHSGATWYEQQLTYMGRQACHLKEWVDDDGRRLREEFESAIAPIAETVVDEIFLIYPIGSERR